VAVTAASFKADPRFSEFAAVADAMIDVWLTSTRQDLNADRWGSKYDEGLKFLAAHSMVMAGVVVSSSSASPTVSSKTVGPVTISYAVGSAGGSGDELESTTYGQIYLRKRRTIVRGPMVL